MSNTSILTTVNDNLRETRRVILSAQFFIDGIGELEQYLQTDKFSTDTTVQVQDVLNRIAAARAMANEVAFDLDVRIPA